MQGQYNHGAAYYRCRYPKEYALASHVRHPGNVYLREADVPPAIDRWLSVIFAPRRLAQTIRELSSGSPSPTSPDQPKSGPRLLSARKNMWSRWIVVGIRFVSEDRHALYVHDQHRPDRGVRACHRRCAMIGTNRIIRWSMACDFTHLFLLRRATEPVRTGRGQAGLRERAQERGGQLLAGPTPHRGWLAEALPR
jgi:hypothetical protein